MFFRRKKKVASPIKGDDGYYYAEEGQEYDSEEFETDSEYSSDASSTNDSDHKSDNESQDSNNQNESEEIGLDECLKAETVASDFREVVDGGNSTTTSPCPANGQMIGSNACPIKDTKNDIDDEVEAEKNDMKNSREVVEENANDVSDHGETLETYVSDNSSAQKTSDVSKGDGDEEMVASDELEDSISLQEKRTLVALAAQHDRVDILKSILQPSPNNRDCAGLAQLLLNNVITDQDGRYTAADLETVFLPPLHIAIASASTNAASCLLRMGSDPSIRPDIPDEWEGPGWTDEHGEIVIDQDIWEQFHGMSAWELAFGTLRLTTNKANDAKKGWFGFRSSSSKGDEDVPELYVPVKIESSKLEGIRHAFTAEALRAIGSDEVGRLKELLDSGLGALESVEIGGKDLYGWCLEMGAKQCVEVLKSHSKVRKDDYQDQQQSDEEKVSETEKGQEYHVDKQDHDELSLQELQNKLEEMKSLEMALSSMLDNLAEEVSVTQGLLMQHGDDSNSALLLQVRQLKKQRAEIDDEITEWEVYVANRYAELDMVSIWWQKRGGALQDIQNVIEQPTENTAPLIIPATDEDEEEQIRSCREKLEQTENKVKKLRSSISSLSKESLRNLQEVKNLGLLGAVNLTRKLKDEVRERKDALESLIQEESSVKNKVKWMRHMLETSDASVDHTSQDSNPTAHHENQVNISEGKQQSDQIFDTYETVDSGSEYSSDDDDDDDDSDESTDASDEKHESHSQSIRRGHSTAIVEWVDDGDLGIFTFKIWALFQRLVGPSNEYTVEETVSEHDDDIMMDTSPRVIII